MNYFFVFNDLTLLFSPGACGLHVRGFGCRSCATFCWCWVGLDRGGSGAWSSSLGTSSLRNWKLMIQTTSTAFSPLIEDHFPTLIGINRWRRYSWSQVFINSFLNIFLRPKDLTGHAWLNLHLIYRRQYMPWNLCTFLIFRHFSEHLVDLERLRLYQRNFCFLVSLFHIFEHHYFVLLA